MLNKAYFIHKLLGEILIEAGLVSSAQVEVALNEQKQYNDFRLGEILVLHGWLKQETTDFFAETWFKLLQEKDKHLFGYYLQKAGLLTPRQIEQILDEQKRLGLKFGSIAVLCGYVNDKTLDFFLKYLVEERHNKLVFIAPSKYDLKKHQKDDSLESRDTKQKVIIPEQEEIKWIG